MSAFIVSKEHIDAMVSAGLTYGSRYGSKMTWANDEGVYDGSHKLAHATADQVGQVLWAENEASVEHRYSPQGREETYGEASGEPSESIDLPGAFNLETIPGSTETIRVPQWLTEYRYSKSRTPSPVEALKLVSCFEYQSCEHDGWKGSEAQRFCEALTATLINALPGYDEAAWEFRG